MIGNFLDECHSLIEVLVFVDGLYKTYNKMKGFKPKKE